MTKKCDLKLEIAGLTTIGPKGQIVIPKDVRSRLGIETGDQFVVLIKNGQYLWLVQNEDIASVMEYVESEK